jgi:phospholipase C
VEAAYHQNGLGSKPKPKLTLTLTNDSRTAATFTIVSNNYAKDHAKTYHVPAHGHATHSMDPLASSDGWYDLTATISGDSSWSRRYVGHLEDGMDSITG